MPMTRPGEQAGDGVAADLGFARSVVGQFTPEKPMIVSSSVMEDIMANGGFDDMLDRIVVMPVLPT